MRHLIIMAWWGVLTVGSALVAGAAFPEAQVARLTSTSGPNGTLRLGDTVAQAQKAFPAPRGAQVEKATAFSAFSRPGWSWGVEKPANAFEVTLKDNRVAGIVRTLAAPTVEAGQNSMVQILRNLPKPSSIAEGKSVAIYAWDAKPYARFVVFMKVGYLNSGPLVIQIIGDREELRRLNYRIDDVGTTVREWDYGVRKSKNPKLP